MIGPGNFLCGCNVPKPGNRPYRMEVVPGSNGQLTTEIKDHQGFLVCPQHGQRLYAWNTPTTCKDSFDAIDYSKMTNSKTVKIEPSEDVRDNRDPEQVGREYLATRNGHNNGN